MTTLNEAMRAVDLDPPDNIQPGKTTRFSTNGKRHDKTGWVHLFPDGKGAAFGCWRSGMQGTWQEKRDKPLSEAEQASFKSKIIAAKKAMQKERESSYTEAADKAQAEWEAAPPAPATHPYLVKEGFKRTWRVLMLMGACWFRFMVRLRIFKAFNESHRMARSAF